MQMKETSLDSGSVQQLLIKTIIIHQTN